MHFKLVLLLSALAMTCAGTGIQDPYIHDLAEDQIAMESGPTHTVVEAPPHLRAAAAAAVAAAAEAAPQVDEEAAQVDADNEVSGPEANELAEPEAEDEVAELETEDGDEEIEPEIKRPAAPFTLLINDEPVLTAAPRPTAFRPAFGGELAFRRPAMSPLMQLSQLSLLSRLQQPRFPQYGAPLGGYAGYGGGSPIVLLQPIIVPVPMSAREMESQPNALTERVMSSLMMQQPLQPRPLSLMDLLQRGYYNF